MSDPFTRWQGLDADSRPLLPLPAAEIRRRGDQMRRRRNAVTAIAAATAVLTVAVSGMFVAQQMAATAPDQRPAGRGPISRTAGPQVSTDSPAGGWRTSIPGRFPLETGLPAPGGDVPAWKTSTAESMPWQGLPCPTDKRGFGTQIEQDGKRADARTIIVQPPAAVESRQLVLYADEVTAVAAVEAIRAHARDCDTVEAIAGISELRYTISDVAFGSTAGLWIGGGEYVLDNGSRAPSRLLAAVVRVGNAVFVGGRSDESTADPQDRAQSDAAALQRATTAIAEEMCIFAAQPCRQQRRAAPPEPGAAATGQLRPTGPATTTPVEPGTPPLAEPETPPLAEPERPSLAGPEQPVDPDPTTDPTPDRQPVLDESNLVTAADLPELEGARPWRAVGPQQVPTLSCQAAWLSALQAPQLLYREFRTPAGRGGYSTAEVNTAVLAYDTSAAAEQAYTTVLGWVRACTDRVDDSRPVAYNDEPLVGFDVNAGRGGWRNVHLHAPDVCQECDAIWFDRQGVAQVGNRLMLASLVRLGGPSQPEGLDAAMKQLLRAVVQAGRS